MIDTLVRFIMRNIAGISIDDQAVDRDGVVGEVQVGGVETPALVRAAVEGANDAHAGQAFVEHEVQLVDLDLHLLEERHGLAHDQEEDDGRGSG